MGLFKRPSWGNSYISDPINPNPNVYRVISSQRFGYLYVVEINYPNCTNFEGNKILVMQANPEHLKSIDPHFTEGGPVLARFEPSKWGRSMAKKFAQMVQSER